MVETVKWGIFQALMWALLYGAFVLQLDGALSVLKFILWTVAVLSLFGMTDKAIRDRATWPARPFARRTLSWVQSWATLGLLVWHGHTFTGVAWAIAMATIAASANAARKLRAGAGA